MAAPVSNAETPPSAASIVDSVEMSSDSSSHKTKLTVTVSSNRSSLSQLLDGPMPTLLAKPDQAETPGGLKIHTRRARGIRRSLSMDPQSFNDADDSPFLSSIDNSILAFRAKRILLDANNENDSPTSSFLSKTSQSILKKPDPVSKTPVLSTFKRVRSLNPISLNYLNIAAGTKSDTNNKTEASNLEKPKPLFDGANVMNALVKSEQNPNLIGDFSKPYALPLIKGKHHDLKTIEPETLASVLKGNFDDVIRTHTVVDCRYPYEYEAGHIVGAKNIFCKEAILKEFFHNPPVANATSTTESTTNDKSSLAVKQQSNLKRSVVVFHCEFSSVRGPNLYRFLRSTDRERNTYPNLEHPEIYLLDGGYKAFFEKFKELCAPQCYLPMDSKDHKHDLRHFKAKSKSWHSSENVRSVVNNSLYTVIEQAPK